MEEFLKNVEKTPGGCWIWKGPTCGAGRYGRVLGKRKFHMAHRLSYQLFRGIDPGKQHVCHHCDNGLCVNPEHLFLGNAVTNAIDMVKKGRCGSLFKKGDQSGENNAYAKINRDTALAVRKYHDETKCSYSQLAAKFGLKSAGHAHSIATGKIWK